jgi:UDP-glucose 4,6-dehydratase
VDNSFGNSFEFTENNIRGTHVLLEAVKTLGTIKRQGLPTRSLTSA